MTPLNWLTAISICFLPIGSCTPTGNADYPSKVSFPASGDDKQIAGSEGVYEINFIKEGGTRIYESDLTDSCMNLSAEWIDVTGSRKDKILDINVKPNNTGKPRNIILHLDCGDNYPTVTIEQSK